MKITALLVVKCHPAGADPVILANATDVSHFGYFQRPSVREFIVFVGRTVASRTPPSQRQSVQHEGLSPSPSPSLSPLISDQLSFGSTFFLMICKLVNWS